VLVIALGFYAWSLHSSLATTEARLAVAERNAVTSKTNADTFQQQVTSQTSALDTCKSELTEANNRAAAAEQAAESKSGGGGRKR
jgi:hypothetical protein